MTRPDEPTPVELTDAQRRHLRLCLARLAQDVEELGTWAESQSFDAASGAALAATLEAVAARATETAQRLGLSLYLEPDDPYRRLGTWASSWWSTILDCRPAALRGYGPVSDSARTVLAPEIDALAGLLMKIQDVAARGGRPPER